MSKTIRKEYTKSKKTIHSTNKHRSRKIPNLNEGVKEWDERTDECNCDDCNCGKV